MQIKGENKDRIRSHTIKSINYKSVQVETIKKSEIKSAMNHTTLINRKCNEWEDQSIKTNDNGDKN